jgi:hypothetical protein
MLENHVNTAKCDEQQNEMTETFEQLQLQRERWIFLAALVS